MPLVTVICICYNHEKYIEECLNSIYSQTYKEIELIVIDNKSSDQSVYVIKNVIDSSKNTKFIASGKNLGHCKAFNLGLKSAKGKYIIDLSADDILLPDRVSKQVRIFETLDEPYGVIFSDAYLIDQKSEVIRTYYKRNKVGELLENVPQGDVYINLIKKSFISAPTMMMRYSLLQHLGGYDENLSYEDYDFWVRSAREYHYYFQNEVLTGKRELDNSSNKLFYKKNQNEHLLSTLKVCRKAMLLNMNKQEDKALAVSVRYHLRLSYYTQNFKLVNEYAELLSSISDFILLDKIIVVLAKMNVKVNVFYRFYLALIKK